MNIQLKNVKHSEFASQETHCYQATLWFNGKRYFMVGNDGRGGCDDVYGLDGDTREQFREKLAEVNKYVATLNGHTFMDTYIQPSLDGICCDLVNKFLRQRDAKRILKKVSYFNSEGDLYQVNAKPTPENIERVKAAKWWKPDNVLLNGMTLDDVCATMDRFAEQKRAGQTLQEVAAP